MFNSLLDKKLSLAVVSEIDDEVNHTVQLAVSQFVDLLQTVAVGVVQTRDLGVSQVIDFPSDRFNEGLVFDGCVDWDVSLGFDLMRSVELCLGFSPFLELWHLLPRELVAVACDPDDTIRVNHELGILEAPAVVLEPLFFVTDFFALAVF